MSTKEKAPETKTETEFKSFCGFDYDPAKKGDCFTTCKKENPDEFKRCDEHFKTKPIAEKKKASGGRGKSQWGHINGTQAGLIDDSIVNATKALTLDEIRELSGAATNYRTLHHLKHLVKDLEVDVQVTKEFKILWADNKKVKAKGVASISTLVLKKKAAKKEDKKEDSKKENKGDK